MICHARAPDSRAAIGLSSMAYSNTPPLSRITCSTVARGTMMASLTTSDEATSCEFQTAQDVRLWPIEIVSASYFSFAPDLPLNALPVAQRIRGGLRIRLKTTAGVKFSQLALDRLTFYLTGRDDVANKLYELCLASTIGALIVPGAKGSAKPHEFLPASAVRAVGFTDEEALLPATLRSFQGYRLLQEYFSFPQRYRFVEVAGGEELADLGESGVDRVGEPGADQQANTVARDPACFGGLVRFVLVVEDEVERVVVQDRGHGCLGSAPTSSRAW